MHTRSRPRQSGRPSKSARHCHNDLDGPARDGADAQANRRPRGSGAQGVTGAIDVGRRSAIRRPARRGKTRGARRGRATGGDAGGGANPERSADPRHRTGQPATSTAHPTFRTLRRRENGGAGSIAGRRFHREAVARHGASREGRTSRGAGVSARPGRAGNGARSGRDAEGDATANQCPRASRAVRGRASRPAALRSHAPGRHPGAGERNRSAVRRDRSATRSASMSRGVASARRSARPPEPA